jgi:hypothetical protein
VQGRSGGLPQLYLYLIYTSAPFLTYLRMLDEIFGCVQRAGIVQLENDVEEPEKSRIFSRDPEFLHDQTVRPFICDSLRMLLIGVTTRRNRTTDGTRYRPAEARPLRIGGGIERLRRCATGLGIVAAVLGVVITLQAIGASPETVCQKVATALVDTFPASCCAMASWGRWPHGRSHPRAAGGVSRSLADRGRGIRMRLLTDARGGVQPAARFLPRLAWVRGYGRQRQAPGPGSIGAEANTRGEP